MDKQILSTQLTEYGLEEIEAQVYLFLLEAGPQTPLELSRAINIDRSKVYRSIEKLTTQGFIEQSHAAWGKKLRAATPDNISRLLKQEEEALQHKKESLPDLIKGLSNISTIVQREFEVKHYRGQEGLRQMLWNHLAATTDIVALSYKNKNDIVGKRFAEKIRAEQLARGIVLYEVENETDQGDYWYTDIGTKNKEAWEKCYKSRHIPPEVLEITQYIAVYNHTVSIINWQDGEEVGLEIINKPFADMQRQQIWKFWELAGDASAQ